MRIPYRDQPVGKRDEEAVGPMQRLQAGRHSLGERPKGILKQRLVDGISDHLGVGRRMEYRASRLEAVAELLCAHQVAVVRHRHTAPSQAKQERLDVFDGIVACRCIAHMSQGDFTGTQLFQARLTEGLPHQPGSAVEAEAIPSAHDDSTALLPAVLQGIQPIIHILRGRTAMRIEHPEDPAFLPYLSHPGHPFP